MTRLTCTKIRYESAAAANRRLSMCLKQRRRSRNKRRKENKAYQCPRCKHWHLTSALD